MSKVLTLVSWPRAIVHIDGDGFFASVEQALNPSYKGKPLITGHERGIASAMSIEAKALGIVRGMPVAQVKKNFPECIIVKGHYEAYHAFALRMFAIMRKYTPVVEEYSIDEAFADITGLRRYFHCGYKEIAAKMQEEIEKDLGITVSVGVSLSKSLAKICSNFRKPHGLTAVKGRYIHILLQHTPIQKVWGIGNNTACLLQSHGCRTAYDFVQKPLPFVKKYLTKKELEIYKELRGEYIYKVSPSKKETYKSISKAKTFKPTLNKEKLFAQLCKNIEEATAKCRKYKLEAKRIAVALKTQEFETSGREAKLNRQSSSPLEISKVAREIFDVIFEQGKLYRQTVCILTHLAPEGTKQLSIFDNQLYIEKTEKLDKTIDEINKHFGRGTIHLASSLDARKKTEKELKIPILEINV